MSPQRIISLAVLLLIITVFIVAASRSPKTELALQRNPSVINNTKSLEVISAVRNNGELYLALRNDYSKKVTALAISSGTFRVTEEFVYSEFDEAGILPSATYERKIPIPDSNSPIQIQAVFLDGGDADGNAAVVQEIRDERLGGRVQIERTLKVLNDYLKSPNARLKGSVNELKSQVSSRLDAPESESLTALRELQPSKPTNMLSENTQTGLANGKQRILKKLQEVTSAQDPKAEISKVQQHYEKVLSRF